MSDFTNTPIDKLMNSRHVGNLIDDLQTKTAEGITVEANSLDEIASDLGVQVSGEFITPTTEDINPESTGFTGSFMSALGHTFNGVIYHIGSVAAGVLQWGANTAGKLIAGAGAVTLDATGVTIILNSTYSNTEAYKLASSSGVVESGIYGYSNAGESAINVRSYRADGKDMITFIASESVPGKTARINIYAKSGNSTPSAIDITSGTDAAIRINNDRADVDTYIEGVGDINLIFVDAGNDRVGIGTAAPTSKLHVNGNSDLDGAVIINESSADVDTRIEGNGDANLVYVDAGNDRVGIGTAAPGYKLDVNGDVNVASGSNFLVNGSALSLAPTQCLIFGQSMITTVTVSDIVDASQPYGGAYGVVSAADAADADEFNFPLYIRAGTYTMSVLSYTGSNRGKTEYYVDGNLVAGAADDWYSASTVYNVRKSRSVTVTGNGHHVLKVKVNGKNAGSSDYVCRVTTIEFKPTSY